MITQRYNLNLIPDKVPVIVNCSQYDALSRTIEMVIYDGSTVYEIPSGTSASVRGTKQDNTGFEYPCTIDGSIVSFDIQDQMTIFAGRVPCEIRLSKDGGIIGTCNFLLNVEETPLDPDVTISETDLPLLEEAEQNAIRAEQAAEEAVQVLSTAVKSVNDVLPDSQGNVDVVALPTGGTADQVLVKQSSTDGDAAWETAGMWHGDEVSSLTTLYGDSAKTEALYPRTKVSAISDGNNTSLEELLQNLDTDLVNLGAIADLNLSGVAETTYIGMTRSNTLNRPDGATSAFVIFESVTPNYGRIMYYSDAGIYTRHKESGTWSGWNTIIRNNPSYSNATLNSSYFSSGNVSYCKTGNIVSVNIQDAVLKTAVEGVVANIITGLPAPADPGMSLLLQQYGTDQSWRVLLNADGSIRSHYDAQSASESQWYGNFTYVVKEA